MNAVLLAVAWFSLWFVAGLGVCAALSLYRWISFVRFVRADHPPVVERVRWPEP